MRIFTIIFLSLVLSQPIIAEEEKPFVMISLGDSITKAFNSGGFFFPRLKNSWAAGWSSYVNSHASRLRQELGRDVKAYNYAITGSHVNDLSRQVTRGLRRNPDYATILIGANDVCDWQRDYKSELAWYAKELRVQIDRLIAHNEDIMIQLISIPDLYQLWERGKNQCQAKWDILRFCDSMLGSHNSEEDRLLVDEKWQRANEVLAEVAAEYPGNIKFSTSVMNYQFSYDEISRVDCFHPSVKGQRSLAEETWKEGWFAGE